MFFDEYTENFMGIFSRHMKELRMLEDKVIFDIVLPDHFAKEMKWKKATLQTKKHMIKYCLTVVNVDDEVKHDHFNLDDLIKKLKGLFDSQSSFGHEFIDFKLEQDITLWIHNKYVHTHEGNKIPFSSIGSGLKIFGDTINSWIKDQSKPVEPENGEVIFDVTIPEKFKFKFLPYNRIIIRFKDNKFFLAKLCFVKDTSCCGKASDNIFEDLKQALKSSNFTDRSLKETFIDFCLNTEITLMYNKYDNEYKVTKSFIPGADNEWVNCTDLKDAIIKLSSFINDWLLTQVDPAKEIEEELPDGVFKNTDGRKIYIDSTFSIVYAKSNLSPDEYVLLNLQRSSGLFDKETMERICDHCDCEFVEL